MEQIIAETWPRVLIAAVGACLLSALFVHAAALCRHVHFFVVLWRRRIIGGSSRTHAVRTA